MRLRGLSCADALGWLLGLGALAALPLPGQAGPALLLAGLGGLLLLAGRPGSRRGAALAAVACVAGFLIGSQRVETLGQQPLRARIGSTVAGGRVVVEEAWRGSSHARIAAGTLLGANGGPVLLRVDGGAPPERGSVLEVDGRLVRPRGPRNGFDEEAWLAQQGIHAVLRITSLRVVGRRGGLWGLSDQVRSGALAALAPAGRGDPGQVVAGLAFGADAGLTPATVEAFRASGLAHLLAVSGGNVALLVALLVLATWVFGGNRRQALVLAIGVVCLYVAVVGPSPSVLRAGVAGVVGCLTWLVGRPRDAWRALALGFGGLIVWNPWSVLDPGLQLSFVAVAAILLVVPFVRRVGEQTVVPLVVVAAVAVTGAATLATAPIAWWHFGRASIVASLPANLAAAPAVPLALWAALVATVLTPVAPAAGAGIAWCSQWPAAWILLCARSGAWLAAVLPDWVGLVLAGAVALIIARLVPGRPGRVGWRYGRRPARSGLPAEWDGSRQDPAGR